jgi:hypothetical protein
MNKYIYNIKHLYSKKTEPEHPSYFCGGGGGCGEDKISGSTITVLVSVMTGSVPSSRAVNSWSCSS